MKSLWLGFSTCFWILVFMVFSPISAHAAIHPPPCDAAKEVKTDFGCIKTDPVGFVSDFYAIGLSFISGVSLLVIIYGAYLILTSQGNPDQLKSGKQAIYYAIAGILLAVFGFVFIQLVGQDILKIPGF